MAGQRAVGIQTILEALGHKQTAATVITYDNTIAGNIANKKCKIRRTKPIAMRYHWIQDRIEDGHFKIQWAPGALNLADYPSKAHPIHHFCSHRRYFITLPTNHAPPSIT
jgi:hypothetical protein